MARNSENNIKPPVKEGQIHKASVVGFGKTGDPIVKVEKYTIFIKDAQPIPQLQDELMIKIEKVCPNYGFATALGNAQ